MTWRSTRVVALFAAVVAATVTAAALTPVAAQSAKPYAWLFEEPAVKAHGVRARAGEAGDVRVDVFGTKSTARPGLFATTALKAGDTVIGIPMDLMFHPSRLNDTLLSAFLQYTQREDNSFFLNQRVILTIGLLHQYVRFAMRSGVYGLDKLLEPGSPHAEPWDQLLAALPKRPQSVLLFDDFELQQLQLPAQSPLFARRDEQLEFVTTLYKFVAAVLEANAPLKKMFPKDVGFSEQWFRWAYTTVLNRAIELPLIPWSADDSAAAVLVPFVDLANHANPPNANSVLELVRGSGPLKAGDTTKHLNRSYLRMVAARDIAAGEEITLSYSAYYPAMDDDLTKAGSAAGGATAKPDAAPEKKTSAGAAADATRAVVPLAVHGFSNTELLVNFGLALPVNEYEHIALDIGFDDAAGSGGGGSGGGGGGGAREEDPLWDHKQRIIRLNALARKCLVSVDGVLPDSFVHALRVKQFTRDDLQRLSHFGYQFDPKNGLFSLQNELRMQLQLLSSVEELLRTYPTTLKDDTQMAAAVEQKSNGKPTNLQQIVAYRMSVKRVLHVLILRSLSSLHELFVNLTTRWRDDLSAAVAALPGGADATAADATTADEKKDDGMAEVQIDAQPDMPPITGRWDAHDPLQMTGSGAGRGGSGGGDAKDDAARARREWRDWQRLLGAWQQEIARWAVEHKAWVRDVLGGAGDFPAPRPDKPLALSRQPELFAEAAAAASGAGAGNIATALPRVPRT